MSLFRTWTIPGDRDTSPRQCQLRVDAVAQQIEWSEETIAGPPQAHSAATWTQSFAELLARGPDADCPPEIAEALRRHIVRAGSALKLL